METGTALRFNEEARATFIAQLLHDLGHGVLWKQDAPIVIMTSAGRSEVREITKKHKGVIEEWWKLANIDCGRER